MEYNENIWFEKLEIKVKITDFLFHEHFFFQIKRLRETYSRLHTSIATVCNIETESSPSILKYTVPSKMTLQYENKSLQKKEIKDITWSCIFIHDNITV
jgi:hypothetical protein